MDSAGAEGNAASGQPSVSFDGRYVAFDSAASNLVLDTNGAGDVFVRDVVSGVTTRVSVDSSGRQATGAWSERPAISGDGRYVAFDSGAANLVLGDLNKAQDVFVHDRDSGTTTRVSVGSMGLEANGHSFRPAISANGRFVAFESVASNLTGQAITGGDDTNGVYDIFVHDRDTGATTRVSVDSAGGQASGGHSLHAAVSDDGRYVAFNSSATNLLVAGDTNGASDIFVHDRQTGATTRASVDSAGAEATGGESLRPSLSADGRLVAFDSQASNLVAGDTNGSFDVFAHDRQSGATTRVSVSGTGAAGNGGSGTADLSDDGRYVAFSSVATNLVANDVNSARDVFVHDRATGSTTRANLDSAGNQAFGTRRGSDNPALSGDGRFAAFDSDAPNLVPDDTNNVLDVFLRHWTAVVASATASTVVAEPASVPADGTTTTTVTVTLKAADGSPVPAKAVRLATASGPGTPAISPASGTSDAAGVVRFAVASTTVGTNTFAATDTTDGVVVDQRAEVAFVAPARTLEETDPAASFAWAQVSAPKKAYGGSYVTERLAGASASYAFSGTAVTWYTLTGPNQGTARVAIDGVDQGSFDLYAKRATYKVARSFSGLAAGAHTITVTVTGQKAPASTDTLVAVDAFAVGRSVDATPALTARWAAVSASGASGGAYARADLAGAEVTVSFTGTQVEWFTVAGPGGGQAEVYVDGARRASVDTYAPTTTYGVAAASIGGLADGPHTLRIVVSGTKQAAATGTSVAVDRWVVR
ncbi:MAG: Ig-like domain-containing protein [Actinomycetota bacterium]|nr:Ig-like domain-containing protein [Actinomycetota bacterium]